MSLLPSFGYITLFGRFHLYTVGLHAFFFFPFFLLVKGFMLLTIVISIFVCDRPVTSFWEGFLCCIFWFDSCFGVWVSFSFSSVTSNSHKIKLIWVLSLFFPCLYYFIVLLDLFYFTVYTAYSVGNLLCCNTCATQGPFFKFVVC